MVNGTFEDDGVLTCEFTYNFVGTLAPGSVMSLTQEKTLKKVLHAVILVDVVYTMFVYPMLLLA